MIDSSQASALRKLAQTLRDCLRHRFAWSSQTHSLTHSLTYPLTELLTHYSLTLTNFLNYSITH